MAASKSITPSKARAVRIQALIFCRSASPGAPK